jgi:flagellar hook assembly protein FlgD
VNRWGNTIREFTDPAFQWDGTDEKGNEMEEGVYFYVARTITNAGDEIEKQGLVHLVRD